MRNEAYWRYQVYRDRVARALGDRFPLRMHMAIIVAAAVFAGIAFDALMVAAGSKSMLSRYPFAILVGHATFLAGIGLWLRFSGVAGFLTRRKAHLIVGEDVCPPEPWKPASPEVEVNVGVGAEPQVFLYVIGGLLALTVVLFVLGGWAVVAAPSIFGDAVLAKMHAARLLARVETVERAGWITAVLRHTGFTIAFGLAAAIAVGWYARAEAPGTNSLLDLF